ncbi:hypothetical protein L204_103462 [Cryptococcus depauperatus]|nr:cytoplasmic protein [Cryptococcus depauperatus CBS 7855]
MLPLPNAARRGHASDASSHILNTLRARTRLTNLAVVFLILALMVSLILNFNVVLKTSQKPSYSSWLNSATPEQLHSPIPLSLHTTIERDPRYAYIDHLIMVPGHAIWLGHDADRVEQDEDWILEPMQKGGSIQTFVKHIRRGVQALEEDPHSLLVFSGGATRSPPSLPTSESLSYYRLAVALSLIPQIPLSKVPKSSPLPLNLRTATEEYALDSYQNLLFSIARFKEVTGTYPKKITVVGYGMKQRRFEKLHRVALRFPSKNFHYIGIDDQGDTTSHYIGELRHGYLPFLASPSGCHPPLSIKRLIRNPYARFHPYFTSCPELSKLFEWCPPVQKYNDSLTWDREEEEEGARFPYQLPWDLKNVAWSKEWS